jgi:tetratricopeptide (TPR) repeat protein
LWEIERLFARKRRRFTISGFGGQGKTYLALEAGRWLYQTGMFDVLCFVDYASFQGVEPVDWAVAELSVALGQSFVDIDAVKLGLQKRKTLVILDNLESLQPEALYGLLTVASGWSEVGGTRLLLTTQDKQFNHPDYSMGRNEYLLLKGLGNEEYPEDAINYFWGLMKLPPEPTFDLPKRNALIELFKLVDFHPLSIRLVALQLKERQIADLVKSLELLLADGQGGLVASLNLSLERLDPNLLGLLLKLGVFQGGAFENAILAVTEILPEQWAILQSALVRIGLVQVEEIGIPFLRFHPNLAPVLWERLAVNEQKDLRLKHQIIYYFLMNYLYGLDSQNPEEARQVAKRELPNLLWAVKGVLADRLENATYFVDWISKFLNYFGLKRDRKFLTECLEQLIGKVVSNHWYLVRCNQGEQLLNTAQYAAAAEIFTETLQLLDPEPSFEQVNVLCRLAQCFQGQGQLANAAEYLQTGINLSEQFEQSYGVKRQRGILQSVLGEVLIGLGQYSKAEQVYKNSLSIKQEIGDLRGIALNEAQLGSLAQLQGDLATAVQKYQSALQTFQQLQEPQVEAAVWHQLGMLYEEKQQWVAADQTYRKAASIREQQGYLTEAVGTYNQIAILSMKIDKLTEAEAWFCKALQNTRIVNDQRGESRQLRNLANLLTNQPKRLSDAQQLATEALAIDQTLDPAATEIWTTYNLLAKIANAQGKTQQAQVYHQQARSAKAAFAGTQYELQKHEPLITAVVAAVADQSAAEKLEAMLTMLIENGWEQFVIAIRRILAGDRSIEALWDDLDMFDSMIICAIIDRLAVKK